MDATAAARPELLHGNSPSILDARVPAIQRPSARSHRTVDNSLITSRIEYSIFLDMTTMHPATETPLQLSITFKPLKYSTGARFSNRRRRKMHVEVFKKKFHKGYTLSHFLLVTFSS